LEYDSRKDVDSVFRDVVDEKEPTSFDEIFEVEEIRKRDGAEPMFDCKSVPPMMNEV
jgi:hypothetical protein